jgi:hypothetical protein
MEKSPPEFAHVRELSPRRNTTRAASIPELVDEQLEEGLYRARQASAAGSDEEAVATASRALRAAARLLESMAAEAEPAARELLAEAEGVEGDALLDLRVWAAHEHIDVEAKAFPDPADRRRVVAAVLGLGDPVVGEVQRGRRAVAAAVAVVLALGCPCIRWLLTPATADGP